MPNVSIHELQTTLDHIRQKKAARRLLASGPQNKAPDPSTAPTIAARIERLRAVTAGAREDVARSAAKASQPAAKPATPATGESILDQFNAMQGAAATAFYRQHGHAIRAELAARNEDQRRIEHEMKQARASARNLRHLEKNNR
jgi:hypothetical protein